MNTGTFCKIVLRNLAKRGELDTTTLLTIQEGEHHENMEDTADHPGPDRTGGE